MRASPDSFNKIRRYLTPATSGSFTAGASSGASVTPEPARRGRAEEDEPLPAPLDCALCFGCDFTVGFVGGFVALALAMSSGLRFVAGFLPGAAVRPARRPSSPLRR